MEESKIIDHFFIIGAGRSGTTLLTNLLNKWDGVSAPPEHDFLFSLLFNYRSKKEFNITDYTTIVESLWVRKREFKNVWNINNNDLLSNLNKEKPQSFESIYLSILQAYKGGEASVIFDKNPFYTYTIDLLLKTFPNSKFIALTRNPLDRYESIKRVNFAKNKTPLQSTVKWNIYNKLILNIKKKHPEKILILKYEDLVRNPEDILHTISKFTSIETKKISVIPENRMQIKNDNNFSERFNQMHELSNQSITSSRIGRWKNHLSDSEINYISYVSSKMAKNLHYSLPSVQLNLSKKLQYNLKSQKDKLKILFFLKLKLISYKISIKNQKKLTHLIRRTFKKKRTNSSD